MAIYSFRDEKLLALEDTTFESEGIRERHDLQRILRDHVEVISPDTMVIAEEFSDWEDSNRRIDLLGLDHDANLVVIELKRTETGGHMELQAIRYAAMVSTMTFQQVVDAHERYVRRSGKEDLDAEELILNFLGWQQPDVEKFADDVRIVLVSAEFSKEITSSVIWLNGRGLDVRCVRIKPYKFEGQVLVDVQRVLPLPEVEEFQTRIREKSEERRVARQTDRDYTRYDLTIGPKVLRRLTKRAAIFETAREAVRRGATPRSISDAIGRPNLWVSADGELDEGQFVVSATEAMENQGRRFDSTRYFTSDEELVKLDGKTYAFTNQWGAGNFEAVHALIRLIGDPDIRCEPYQG